MCTRGLGCIAERQPTQTDVVHSSPNERARRNRMDRIQTLREREPEKQRRVASVNVPCVSTVSSGPGSLSTPSLIATKRRVYVDVGFRSCTDLLHESESNTRERFQRCTLTPARGAVFRGGRAACSAVAMGSAMRCSGRVEPGHLRGFCLADTFWDLNGPRFAPFLHIPPREPHHTPGAVHEHARMFCARTSGNSLYSSR